jgi:hypothetical protein
MDQDHTRERQAYDRQQNKDKDKTKQLGKAT